MDWKKSKNAANLSGIVLTAAVHVVLLGACGFTGLKYLYPPPQEQTFLIDFSQEAEPLKVIETTNGRAPEAEEVDITKPVELVRQSKAQEKGKIRTWPRRQVRETKETWQSMNLRQRSP